MNSHLDLACPSLAGAADWSRQPRCRSLFAGALLLRLAACSIAVAWLLLGGSHANAQSVQWMSSNPIDLRVGLDETVVNNVGFNMLAYAQDYAVARGASRSSVSAYLVANNAYGWRMKYYARGAWRVEGFNMLDVARWTGFRLYGTRVKNYGVYCNNFQSPYAWKGVYILRR